MWDFDALGIFREVVIGVLVIGVLVTGVVVIGVLVIGELFCCYWFIGI